MFSFLSVRLIRASVIVLLTAGGNRKWRRRKQHLCLLSSCLWTRDKRTTDTVSQAQYDDFTLAPDYDSDYNATFEYSFFSNASNEDLDRFSERFIEQEDGEEEDTGGWLEEDVTVTMATTPGTTARGRVDVRSAASLPVCLEIQTLVWTLMILISLNTQQLQQTL